MSRPACSRTAFRVCAASVALVAAMTLVAAPAYAGAWEIAWARNRWENDLRGVSSYTSVYNRAPNGPNGGSECYGSRLMHSDHSVPPSWLYLAWEACDIDHDYYPLDGSYEMWIHRQTKNKDGSLWEWQTVVLEPAGTGDHKIGISQTSPSSTTYGLYFDSQFVYSVWWPYYNRCWTDTFVEAYYSGSYRFPYLGNHREIYVKENNSSWYKQTTKYQGKIAREQADSYWWHWANEYYYWYGNQTPP